MPHPPLVWDAGRLTLTLLISDDEPVSLARVALPGGEIEFAESTLPVSPLIRQASRVQPLVELYLADVGHERSGERRVRSAVGTSLRYRSHEASTDGNRRRLTIVQHDPRRDLEVRLHLDSGGSAGALRSSVEVVNSGTSPFVLAGVTSTVLAPDGTGENFRPDDVALSWARSEWLAENRWVEEPVREQLLPDLGLTLHGQDPRGAFTVSSVGSWSTGEYLPVGVLHDGRSGAAIAWQVESSAGWTWEVGERREGLYMLAQGPDDLAQQWTRRLVPGESFRTVAAAVSFSFAGRDGALGELTEHRRAFRRAHPDGESLRVVYNDYMNTLDGKPTTEALLPLIANAAVVGAEVFVIDAGWYDAGTDWWDTVGVWRPSEERFAGGFAAIFDAIRDAGMAPGLWLEPEVVGVRSPAATSLPPEAFLQRDGRPAVEHQRLHLDLRHPAARAHLDEVVDRLVAQFGIRYFKLDYNISSRAGTQHDAHSPGDGLLGVARAHLEWAEQVLDRHPGLTLENCSSGAMRADYAVLSVLQLQSTSDQQHADLYSPISASAPASILPEQAANWAYPQPEMTDEQIAYTMANGMLGRLYLSGFVDRMSDQQRALVRSAVTAHQGIVQDVARSRPMWPLGLPCWTAPRLALGLSVDDRDVLLTVWDRAASNEPVTLLFPTRVGFPLSLAPVFPLDLPAWAWNWDAATGELRLAPVGGERSARTFRLSFGEAA